MPSAYAPPVVHMQVSLGQRLVEHSWMFLWFALPAPGTLCGCTRRMFGVAGFAHTHEIVFPVRVGVIWTMVRCIHLVVHLGGLNQAYAGQVEPARRVLAQHAAAQSFREAFSPVTCAALAPGHAAILEPHTS